MTNRRDSHDDELVRALDELFADDVFLTDLSRGVDVSDGEDPLANLLLKLRDEVESDMPPTPTLADLGIEEEENEEEYLDEDFDDGELTATDVFEAVDDVEDTGTIAAVDDLEELEADELEDEEEDDEDNVIDLDQRRRRWGFGRIASGLIGAAAATLIIAGGGAAIAGAKEGSPFYGLHQRLFGSRADRAAVVELASKLEEVTNRTNQGDVKGAQQSLQEAQKIVDKLNSGNQKADAQQKVDSAKATVTTVTVTPPPAVQTQTATVTVTVEAVPPAVAPVQTQQQQQNVSPTLAVPSRPSDSTQAPPAEPSQTPVEPPLQLPDEFRR